MDWLYHFRFKKSQLPKISLEEEILAKQHADYLARVKTIDIALSKTVNTPDVADLSNKHYAVIFVYNALMKKRRDHEVLEPVAFCGDAYTTFDVNGWYRKKDKLPIVMKPQILQHQPSWGKQKNAHAAILKGEVFVIPTRKLYDLDLYHDNGVQFIRQRIEVEIPYEEDILNKDHIVVKSGLLSHTRKVWAYLGNPDYWWGEADPFSYATSNGHLESHCINSIDFTPMPIYTPKKTWKELYYYHARQYSD